MLASCSRESAIDTDNNLAKLSSEKALHEIFPDLIVLLGTVPAALLGVQVVLCVGVTIFSTS